MGKYFGTDGFRGEAGIAVTAEAVIAKAGSIVLSTPPVFQAVDVRGSTRTPLIPRGRCIYTGLVASSIHPPDERASNGINDILPQFPIIRLP